jgi:hypothetical protein
MVLQELVQLLDNQEMLVRMEMQDFQELVLI